MKSNFKKIVLGMGILCTMLLSFPVLAGGPATPDYISVTSGDWIDPTTWNINTAGQCRVDDWYAVSNGDSVYASCDPLETTANGTIDVYTGGILHVIGAGGLTGNGDITVEPGGTMMVDGDFNITGNGGLVIDGDLTVGGDVNLGGSGGFYGTGDVTIVGTGCEYWTGTGICTDANSIMDVLFFKVGVTQSNGKPQISWTTIVESGLVAFDIERSIDGEAFKKIGSMEFEPNSLTIGKQEYTYLDENPPKSVDQTLYYRIKEIDKSGDYKYSATVHYILENSNLKTFLIYPNPSRGDVFLELVQENSLDLVNIDVFDAYGTSVMEKVMETNGIIPIVSEQDNLPAGLYFVNLRGEKLNATRRIVLK